MGNGDLPQRNRHEAGLPGFRGHQVIQHIIHAFLPHMIAQGEQIGLRIIESPEVAGADQAIQPFRQPVAPGHKRCRNPLGSST
ncbi:hypothetical protein D3C86_2124700 [compost metagenome]